MFLYLQNKKNLSCFSTKFSFWIILMFAIVLAILRLCSKIKTFSFFSFKIFILDTFSVHHHRWLSFSSEDTRDELASQFIVHNNLEQLVQLFNISERFRNELNILNKPILNFQSFPLYYLTFFFYYIIISV